MYTHDIRDTKHDVFVYRVPISILYTVQYMNLILPIGNIIWNNGINLKNIWNVSFMADIRQPNQTYCLALNSVTNWKYSTPSGSLIAINCSEKINTLFDICVIEG